MEGTKSPFPTGTPTGRNTPVSGVTTIAAFWTGPVPRCLGGLPMNCLSTCAMLCPASVAHERGDRKAEKKAKRRSPSRSISYRIFTRIDFGGARHFAYCFRTSGPVSEREWMKRGEAPRSPSLLHCVRARRCGCLRFAVGGIAPMDLVEKKKGVPSFCKILCLFAGRDPD